MPTAHIERLDTSRIAKILSVALEEFAGHRYRDASFNRIIKASGLAKGTMYYYFTSKEDLYLTLHKAILREFTRFITIAGKPIRHRFEFWLKTRELLEGLSQIMTSKPTLGVFIANFLSRESIKDGHPGLETVHRIEAWLEEFLEEGIRLQAIRTDLSRPQLTALVWSTWESWRPWFGQRDFGPSASLQLVDLFERLLRPSHIADQDEGTKLSHFTPHP